MNGKEEKRSEVESACDRYYRMLGRAPVIRTEHVGGGTSHGLSSSGKIITTYNRSEEISSYDKDTNDLLRAKFACQEDMVVSPLSTNRNTFYVNKGELESHFEEAKQRILDPKNQPTTASSGCTTQ